MVRFPMLLPIAGLAAIACILCADPARAENRVALVIGNSNYEKLAKLTNPANDARLVANTLTGLKFNLVGGGAQLDLDKAGFEKAVRAFGQALDTADVALFYYAGHGVEVAGTNYLIPVSANPTREADVDFELISANLVLKQMGSAKTKLDIVVLDACRNNPLAGRSIRAGGGGLAPLKAPDNKATLISYSTQPGNVADDGTDGNSPYTKAFASTVQKPGLDVFNAFNQVGLRVKISSGGSQIPWVSASPIDEPFYFSGQSKVPADYVLPVPEVLKASIAQPSTPAVAPPSTAASTEQPSFSAGAPKTCNSSGGDYIVKNVKFSDPVGGLMVRSAPRASAAGLGVIPAEATGIAVDTCQGGWCQVRYSCLSGWSSASFLDQRSRNLYRVTGVAASDRDGLNMRVSPGFNSTKTGSIPYNATDVVMHACEAVPNDQTWCLATYANRSGWVAQRFLSQ